MTKEGHDKLQEEVNHLKSVERPRIVEAIKVAREMGDLKENAEYQEAKNEQGLIEARIRDIEGKLSNAQVIDISAMENNGRVIFGAAVTIMNLASDEEFTYKIVGEDEANLKENKLSVTSPIARGVVGKEEGDIVKIETPNGLVEYEIVQVEYK
jgi:transcription elongation factor GreA